MRGCYFRQSYKERDKLKGKAPGPTGRARRRSDWDTRLTKLCANPCSWETRGLGLRVEGIRERTHFMLSPNCDWVWLIAC